MGASGAGYANQGPSIWMSGGGPAVDAAGNVYVLTGNGRFETTLSALGFPDDGDYGNSFVKILPRAARSRYPTTSRCRVRSPSPPMTSISAPEG